MSAAKHFTKSYFEHDFPKLQKLVDRNAQPLSVILTLDEGHRIELREFELTRLGLIVKISSGEYSIPFHTIRSIQFVPQNMKCLILSAQRLSPSAEAVHGSLELS
ncbi:MAG: hypothetical protein L0387_06710 [Acidobacteria bacterium]|nr:hypothetical protein [Acidobacteriota bacterium]MCI0621345.1 hypothetical protein [Acidobacteriota bacterium]MCI0720109.1 hypothetical protein [Acidobacteriota bacterium]